jgi:hypothetical protein
MLHFVKKKFLGGGGVFLFNISTQTYEISLVVTTLQCTSNSHHKGVTECNHPANQAISH